MTFTTAELDEYVARSLRLRGTGEDTVRLIEAEPRLIAGRREAIRLREKYRDLAEEHEARMTELTAAQARIAELERLAREVLRFIPRNVTRALADKCTALAAFLSESERET